MKLNIEGRLKNMRLPDGQTAMLYSIFEAVMNGIQAIEERFPKGESVRDGQIVVTLGGKKSVLDYVSVSDNGIGLNAVHLEAFNECDTQSKADLGGRGVGRLVWTKAFRSVNVRSSSAADGGGPLIEFEFRPDLEESRHNLRSTDTHDLPFGTLITLNGPALADAKLTPVLLARNLCHHFFPFFIARSMPALEVRQASRTINIGQYVSERMSVEKEETVELKAPIKSISIAHVYVDPKIARQLSNSILLTAQGRVVQSIEIEKKFALKELENNKAYVCVVSGNFLDEKVDQERTNFKARVDEIDAIQDAALLAAEAFLADHIATIRKTQKKLVVSLLEEHPQLAVSVDNVDEYVLGLSPSMADEDIAKTLFTLLYRRERKVRDEIHGLSDESRWASEQVGNNVAQLMAKVSEGAKLRLAEYTVKRHQIITIAKSLLRNIDTPQGGYALEAAIHEFICPMGRMLGSRNYGDHNLWLIDDLLSYYQFFASDKSLASLGIAGSGKEPDVLFFNPFGFRREGTSDPVVIIEFKRPGDEKASSDPIDQVLGYVEKLREKTVRDAEGQIVDEIGLNTPFECIVVCDLAEGTKAKLRRSVAQHPTPDGLGFYGFSPAHNASIRVISFKKLFRDAELRNWSFVQHLGLLPEEVATALAASMVPSGSMAHA